MRAHRSGRNTAVLLLLVASILWGTTGTAAAQATGVSPLAIAAVSLGVGGLLQALVGVRAIRRARPVLIRERRILMVGGVAVFCYPLAFYSAMSLGGVTLGTVISLGTAPLAAGLLERMVDGTRLTGRWYLAAALGIGGSTLLGIARAEGGGGRAVLASCLLGLLAGASYAVYSWASGRLMFAGAPRAASMGSVFGLGGLLLLPVLLVTGAPLLGSAQNLAVAAYLALIPMFLGYLLFGKALTKVKASTATTVTLSEPAVAAALAMGLLGERLGIAGWLGLGLIAAALAVLLLPESRERSVNRVPEQVAAQ